MPRIGFITLTALLLLAATPALQAGETIKPNPVASTTDPKIDTDGDGIPDIAEALLGTDPLLADTKGGGLNDKTDPAPLKMTNPIPPGGKPNGLAIVAGKVEDNFDPVTKKDVSDHLELEVKNLTGGDVRGILVFLTIKDDLTGATENYYRQLTGFSIPKGATKTLHFDINGTIYFGADTGHFRANPNSSYYKTINPKTLDVVIAIAGYASANLVLKKNQGGAETVD